MGWWCRHGNVIGHCIECSTEADAHVKLKQQQRRVEVLQVADLIARLTTAELELTQLAPAPRVELDRESVLAMVRLAREALQALSQVH